MIEKQHHTHRIGILASDGDAPGMNAALRAAVRSALDAGAEAIAIREGYRSLVEHGVDRLIVLGGDGSLTAADLLHRQWPGLLAELVEHGRIPSELAARHPQRALAGIGASIDNDMAGTDMLIGADSALHRIAEAVDGIGATAASHQRTFVVEVMGRH